ncbi:transglycosylase SLT domain-containing protein [Vibrio sp. 16]|uniref:transglycosylase SLT domain-containing protein n=1 Tax=Vibrio sp. 16 TaxID=391586 RepID=UPI00018F1B7E|nr:transporter substrate-binding domain-containing protein [Vibrio sp. 16]EED25356.1 amino-acid ABC transporter binding protein [Vibrio sp. 16]CAK4076518.1 Membrane-bound lytic murein transglycosylase F [Vibrio sp. 16]
MSQLTKKWIYFGLAALLIAGPMIYFVHTPQNRLSQIQDSGLLTIATRMNGVGCYFQKDQPAGLDCDLLQSYADSLGVKVKIEKTTTIDHTLDRVKNSAADIAASDLTQTDNRSLNITFSQPLFSTREILVQRKSDGLTTLEQLAGKRLTLQEDSAYFDEIMHAASAVNLATRSPSDPENAAALTLVPADRVMSTLELIDAVSTGDIDFTVADEHIVKGHNGYRDNLDTSVIFGEARDIAFAVKKDRDTSLIRSLNRWLQSDEAQRIINAHISRMRNNNTSDQRTFIPSSGALSPWDGLFKRHAAAPFEWLWLAAQSATESNFKPNAVSRAGAQGLMQLMPETAKEVGVTDSFNPDQNIKGGAEYNRRQYKRWKHLSQHNALAFTFASYNAGAGHVLDAQRLAAEDGANPKQWFTTKGQKGVEDYIVLLQKAEYYTRPMVRHGYCRGTETRDYVRRIFAKHEKFKAMQLTP